MTEENVTRAYWDKVASFRAIVFTHIRELTTNGDEIRIDVPRGNMDETQTRQFIQDVVRPMNSTGVPRNFKFKFYYSYELRVRLVRKTMFGFLSSK